MVQIVPKKFYFLGEVVIQAERHAIVLERGGDIRAQTNRVHPVHTRDCGIAPLRHHSPQLLDRWADANSPWIASLVAARPASGAFTRVNMTAIETDDVL